MVELNHEIIGKSRMFWKDVRRPIIRLKREGDTGPYCPYCDSSLHLSWKWLWLRRTKYCVQSKCKNYQSSRIILGG